MNNTLTFAEHTEKVLTEQGWEKKESSPESTLFIKDCYGKIVGIEVVMTESQLKQCDEQYNECFYGIRSLLLIDPKWNTSYSFDILDTMRAILMWVEQEICEGYELPFQPTYQFHSKWYELTKDIVKNNNELREYLNLYEAERKVKQLKNRGKRAKKKFAKANANA